MSRPPSQFKRVFLPVVLLFVLTAFLTRMALDKSFDQGLRDFGRQTRGFLDPQFQQEWWRVGRVMELTHLNYIQEDKVSYDKLANAALDHALDGLDRYSGYLPPVRYQNLEREGDQRNVGVGIELERHNGHLQVTQLAPDSPAKLAGWQEGDRLIAVGGQDVHDFNVAEVSRLLQGVDGSTVKVIRERPGVGLLSSTLTRHGFDVASVRDAELRPDGVGYLRLTQFGKRSGQELSTNLQALMAKGMRGLVLDLRDNGGGLLESSVDVLEPFLPAKQKVATTSDHNGVKKTLTTTGQGEVHYQGPLVVLVNDSSASASEIVAGALQDTRRAVIVGERTYGKGVVQTVIQLGDGGGLRLTTDVYFLPSDRSIEGKGIIPDIIIAQTAEVHDLERLQRADLQQANPGKAKEEFQRTYGFSPVIDPQMETAVGLIRALSPGFIP